MNKSRIRDEARRRRAAVTADRVRRRGLEARALDRLEGLPEFAAAARVLCYVGVRDELSTRDRIDDWLEQGRAIAVPRCDGGGLAVCPIGATDALESGRFGLLEPAAESATWPPETIDLFVVPGLAFTLEGGRLGYGGGFFDRLLQHRRASAVVVGLAFEAQVVEDLPAEPHDVPMEVVVTDATAYRSERRPPAPSGE